MHTWSFSLSMMDRFPKPPPAMMSAGAAEMAEAAAEAMP
jgi:hypothetical protein